jgi:inositol oxygenase
MFEPMRPGPVASESAHAAALAAAAAAAATAQQQQHRQHQQRLMSGATAGEPDSEDDASSVGGGSAAGASGPLRPPTRPPSMPTLAEHGGGGGEQSGGRAPAAAAAASTPPRKPPQHNRQSQQQQHEQHQHHQQQHQQQQQQRDAPPAPAEPAGEDDWAFSTRRKTAALGLQQQAGAPGARRASTAAVMLRTASLSCDSRAGGGAGGGGGGGGGGAPDSSCSRMSAASSAAGSGRPSSQRLRVSLELGMPWRASSDAAIARAAEEGALGSPLGASTITGAASGSSAAATATASAAAEDDAAAAAALATSWAAPAAAADAGDEQRRHRFSLCLSSLPSAQRPDAAATLQEPSPPRHSMPSRPEAGGGERGAAARPGATASPSFTFARPSLLAPLAVAPTRTAAAAAATAAAALPSPDPEDVLSILQSHDQRIEPPPPIPALAAAAGFAAEGGGGSRPIILLGGDDDDDEDEDDDEEDGDENDDTHRQGSGEDAHTRFFDGDGDSGVSGGTAPRTSGPDAAGGGGAAGAGGSMGAPPRTPKWQQRLGALSSQVEETLRAMGVVSSSRRGAFGGSSSARAAASVAAAAAAGAGVEAALQQQPPPLSDGVRTPLSPGAGGGDGATPSRTSADSGAAPLAAPNTNPASSRPSGEDDMQRPPSRAQLRRMSSVSASSAARAVGERRPSFSRGAFAGIVLGGSGASAAGDAAANAAAANAAAANAAASSSPPPFSSGASGSDATVAAWADPPASLGEVPPAAAAAGGAAICPVRSAAALELLVRLGRARQTLDFSRRQAAAFSELNRAELSVWEALTELDRGVKHEYEAALLCAAAAAAAADAAEAAEAQAAAAAAAASSSARRASTPPPPPASPPPPVRLDLETLALASEGALDLAHLPPHVLPRAPPADGAAPAAAAAAHRARALQDALWRRPDGAASAAAAAAAAASPDETPAAAADDPGVRAVLDALRRAPVRLDPDFPLLEHALQTAELCRLAFPDKPYMALVGLVHGLGKLLAHERWGAQPPWAVGGETFPLGCRFSPLVPGYDFFAANPDRRRRAFAASPTGVYGVANPGLKRVYLSWGAPEYIYMVLVLNRCPLPEDALFVLRAQRCYALTHPCPRLGDAYRELLAPEDAARLPLLLKFQQIAVHRRVDLPDGLALDGDALRAHYDALIERYLGAERLLW